MTDDLGELKALGVPQKQIEDLREEDRKVSNAWHGRPQTLKQHKRIWNRTQEERAARLFALQPFSKLSDEEILRRAGYSDHKIKQAKRTVKSLSNSPAFVNQLARYGIGPKLVAGLIAEGILNEIPLRTKYNEIVTDKETGEPVMVPDHGTRLAYLDRVLDITGARHESTKDDAVKVSGIFLTIMQKVEKMGPEEREKIASGDFSAIDAEFSVEDEPQDGESE